MNWLRSGQSRTCHRPGHPKMISRLSLISALACGYMLPQSSVSLTSPTPMAPRTNYTLSFPSQLMQKRGIILIIPCLNLICSTQSSCDASPQKSSRLSKESYCSITCLWNTAFPKCLVPCLSLLPISCVSLSRNSVVPMILFALSWNSDPTNWHSTMYLLWSLWRTGRVPGIFPFFRAATMPFGQSCWAAWIMPTLLERVRRAFISRWSVIWNAKIFISHSYS